MGCLEKIYLIGIWSSLMFFQQCYLKALGMDYVLILPTTQNLMAKLKGQIEP
jgi:hypothetical protein